MTSRFRDSFRLTSPSKKTTNSHESDELEKGPTSLKKGSKLPALEEACSKASKKASRTEALSILRDMASADTDIKQYLAQLLHTLMDHCTPSKSGSDDNKLLRTIFAFFAIGQRTQPNCLGAETELLSEIANLPERTPVDACKFSALLAHAHLVQPFFPLPDIPLSVEPSPEIHEQWWRQRPRIAMAVYRNFRRGDLDNITAYVASVEDTCTHRKEFGKKSKEYRRQLAPVAPLYCALGRRQPLDHTALSHLSVGLCNWNADASRISASSIYAHSRSMVEVDYIKGHIEQIEQNVGGLLKERKATSLADVAEAILPFCNNSYILLFTHLDKEHIRPANSPPSVQGAIDTEPVSNSMMKDAIGKLPKPDDTALRGIRKVGGEQSAPPLLLPHLPARFVSPEHALYNIEWSNPNVTLSASDVSTRETANILLDSSAGVYCCRCCGLIAGIDVHKIESMSNFCDLRVNTEMKDLSGEVATHVSTFPDEESFSTDAGDTGDKPVENGASSKGTIWDGIARRAGVHSSRYIPQHTNHAYHLIVMMSFDRRWRVSLEASRILAAGGVSRILNYELPSDSGHSNSTTFLKESLSEEAKERDVSEQVMVKVREVYPRSVVPSISSGYGVSLFSHLLEGAAVALEHAHALFDPSLYIYEGTTDTDATLRDVLQLSRMAASTSASSSVSETASNHLEQQVQHRGALICSAAKSVMFLGRAWVDWQVQAFPWVYPKSSGCSALLRLIEQSAQAGGPFADVHSKRFACIRKKLKANMQKIQKRITSILLQPWSQGSRSVQEGIGPTPRRMLLEALMWTLDQEDIWNLESHVRKDSRFLHEYDLVEDHCDLCLYAISQSLAQLGRQDSNRAIKSMNAKCVSMSRIGLNTSLLGTYRATTQQQRKVYQTLSAIQFAAISPLTELVRHVLLNEILSEPRVIMDEALEATWDTSMRICLLIRRCLSFTVEKRNKLTLESRNLCIHLTRLLNELPSEKQCYRELWGRTTFEHPGMASLVWNGDSGVIREETNDGLRYNVGNMLRLSHASSLPWEWQGQSGETVTEASSRIAITAVRWIGKNLAQTCGLGVRKTPTGDAVPESTDPFAVEPETPSPAHAPQHTFSNSNPFEAVVDSSGIPLSEHNIRFGELCQSLYRPIFELLWQMYKTATTHDDSTDAGMMTQGLVEGFLEVALGGNIIIKGTVYELLLLWKETDSFIAQSMYTNLRFLASIAAEQVGVMNGTVTSEQSKVLERAVSLFPVLRGYDILDPAI
eukprot:gb/GECG01014113.1/.p1 GENE.gb/GECG01014113.1/~~gb/GECG01014113.1/.p1  ORF type:complete len:1255 (+),score=125.74 gb/GECG01014113.1/:1-3765(+)